MTDIPYTTASDPSSSLKYEKTENRDIVNTIERINRAEKFKPLATKIVDLLGEGVSSFAQKEFRQQWRNKHSGHENPKVQSIDVFVGSPIYHKKEDGFYYNMELGTVFNVDCVPAEGKTMEDATAELTNWFFDNISAVLVKNVVEHLDSTMKVDVDTNGVAVFTLLQKAEVDNRIGGKKPSYGKMNIVYKATLVPRKPEGNNKDSLPFKDSEMVRGGLVHNIAMALERIDSNTKKEQK